MKSTIRIPDLINDLKEKGYTACALTDHHVLFGAAAFIDASRKNGIRPIIGMEVTLLYHDEKVPFILLSMNNKGYQNLIHLSSLLQSSNCDYVTTDDFVQYAEGSHIIAYGEGGLGDSELVNEQYDALKDKICMMKSELPEFDMALSYQEASLWKNRNAYLKRICNRNGIRTVALNKICYLNKKDAYAFRVLTAIDKGVFLNDASLPNIQGRHLLRKEEMQALYEKDDLERTDEIVRMCTADYQLEKTSLPEFPLPEGVSTAEYLRSLAYAGLKKRRNHQPEKEYVERLKYELDLIARMGFSDYFLIVYDYIRYARQHGIYIGPGRGSAAGSLVSYCLGITMVDPLEYDLLFERFLNPERITMPDIDTDIPDNRREELIHYVYEKYGRDHVCSIVTFGTFGAKQSLRDAGKVMGISERNVDALTKLVPAKAKVTLKLCYETQPRFRQMVDSDNSYHDLFATACMIEGLPRHTSTHAAGVVMSHLPLESVVPTIQLNEGMKTCQFTMEYLEERGLIKMDFLGLRNLSIIDEIVREIKKTDPAFDIMKINMNDLSVYRVFQQADTTGIFQFESEGMKNLLRRMQPKNMEDIACAMALYRPGAFRQIPSYLDKRNGRESTSHTYSVQVQQILKDTCGIMIYQEQVMNVARVMAGFTLGQADILRRAISKKKADVLSSLKEQFLNGCRKRGYSLQEAESVFADIEQFAGYGFNKSHAIAYSWIAYQLAFLKCHYPLIFYTALLNSCIGDTRKSAQYIDECRKRKITICYPDVNVSESVCRYDEGSIILPFTAISAIGTQVSTVLIRERKENGLFRSYFDFVARASLRKLSRTHILNLIKAGALDCFELNRETMKNALDDAIRYGELVRIDNNGVSTINLDLISTPDIIRYGENIEDRNDEEREVLGFTLGPSLVARIRQEMGIRTPVLSVIASMKGRVEGFGALRFVKEYRTRKGSMMAFTEITDETGVLEMRVMPRQYEKYSSVLIKGSYLLFHAKITDEGYLIAEDIRVIKRGGKQ